VARLRFHRRPLTQPPCVRYDGPMNAIQVHLAVNHVPVIGVPIAAFLLAWAWWRRARDTETAASVLLALCAVAGFVALRSGEAAEDLAEGLAGVAPGMIHHHEEAAELAFYALAALGAAAAVNAARLLQNRPPPAWRLPALLAGALLVTALLARAAHEGGLIRHPELDSTALPAASAAFTLHPLGPAGCVIETVRSIGALRRRARRTQTPWRDRAPAETRNPWAVEDSNL
jgi:hypothetical protein